MNSKNTRSSQDLRKDVLQKLNQVNHDINRIQQRLSPGQIIDDAIFYGKGGSPAATFDHLKANPIGTTFLAVGTILLMEDKQHLSYETRAKQSTRDAYDVTRTRASGVFEEARHKASRIKENVQQKIQNLRHKGEEKGPEIKQEMNQKISEIKENISGETASAKQKLSAKVGEARASLEQSLQEVEPWTFIALGAGLGVLSGAAFSVTERERAFVSDKLSDKFGQRLQFMKDDFSRALNQSVQILKDEFLDELKDVNVNLFKEGPSTTTPPPSVEF